MEDLLLQKCCKIITNLKSRDCHTFSKPNFYWECKETKTPLSLVPGKVTNIQKKWLDQYILTHRNPVTNIIP